MMAITEDQKRVEELESALRKMEWIDFGPNAVSPEPKIWKQCQFCYSWIDEGHKEYCIYLTGGLNER
jgi:hypothetical protein